MCLVPSDFRPTRDQVENMNRLGVSHSSLFKLNPKQWLNDEVVNAFIRLIQEKCLAEGRVREESTYLTTWASENLRNIDAATKSLKIDKLFKKVITGFELK